MRTLLCILLLVPAVGWGQTPSDLFQKAIQYYESEEYRKAADIYSDLLENDSTLYSCWDNRGMCYYWLGEYNLALSDFNKALEMEQSDSSLYYMIGITYMGLERWAKGIEFTRYAKQKGYPKTYLFYSQLGSAFYFSNQIDSAIKYLTKGYELNSTDETILTNLGFCYQYIKPEKSCVYFNQAYEQDSLDPYTINNLGYSHYLCGNLKQAFEYFNRSLQLDPTNSYVYRNIGLYYKQIGDSDKACKYMTMALERGFIAEWGQTEISELVEYCK